MQQYFELVINLIQNYYFLNNNNNVIILNKNSIMFHLLFPHQLVFSLILGQLISLVILVIFSHF
jgi:hypothetical protein